MKILKKLTAILSPGITCIPVSCHTVEFEDSMLPLFSLQAQTDKPVFRKTLLHAQQYQHITSHHAVFNLLPGNIFSILTSFGHQRVFIELPLKNIQCCVGVLALFRNKAMIIENADEPGDGLFVVPLEEAVSNFGDQFENKVKPLMFKKIYVASMKGRSAMPESAIDRIRFNNPDLYKSVFDIFEKR